MYINNHALTPSERLSTHHTAGRLAAEPGRLQREQIVSPLYANPSSTSGARHTSAIRIINSTLPVPIWIVEARALKTRRAFPTGIEWVGSICHTSNRKGGGAQCRRTASACARAQSEP